MNKISNQELKCCPEFNPEPWDDELFEWHQKKFIKRKVPTIFYIPLNFGKAMRIIDGLITSSNASEQEPIWLSEHVNKWKMDLFISVDKHVENAENIVISGKFYSKVFDGSFKDSGKWNKDFDELLNSKGYKTLRRFMWYTTCPRCAKTYGKNYVVLISQIE